MSDKPAALVALRLLGTATSDEDVLAARRNNPELDRLLAEAETQEGGVLSLDEVLDMVRTMSTGLDQTLKTAHRTNRRLAEFETGFEAFWAEYKSSTPLNRKGS